MSRCVRPAGTLLLLLICSACDYVERARSGGQDGESAGSSAGAGTLTLRMQSPGMLRAGQEGTIRMSVTNRGESAAGGVRLDLIVPGWLELAPPRPGEREVTMAAEAGEGTRFSYRLDDPPLGAGETQLIEQRVRVPLESPTTRGPGPWSRVLQARLVGAGGEPLTELQSEIFLDSAYLPPSASATQEAVVRRDQLGPARVGMPVSELRQQAAGARDTTWAQEGTTEQGLILRVEDGEALAVLSGDSVLRIEVRDSAVRTREGLGVGSTLQDLRAAYGRTCGALGEGIVVVWFPAAPGISFALDTPMSAFREAGRQAERLPGSAAVTRWWLRRGTDDCPVTGG